MTYTFPIATAFPNATLRREIDRMFDDVFAPRAASKWQPMAAAREDGAGYTVEVDLPGVDPQSVELLAEEGVLTLKGSRVHRALAEGEKAVFSEVASGDFVRRFRLPKAADLQAVSASYALGVLSIRVAKVAPAQPRRVPVTVQSPSVNAASE